MMGRIGSGGPSQTATKALQKPQHYNRTDDLTGINARKFNQINVELRLLRSDFDRMFNGYKQLGIAHAELLLDLPQAWREYLLDNVYVSTMHSDIRDDIVTFLETVERYHRLKGGTE